MTQHAINQEFIKKVDYLKNNSKFSYSVIAQRIGITRATLEGKRKGNSVPLQLLNELNKEFKHVFEKPKEKEYVLKSDFDELNRNFQLLRASVQSMQLAIELLSTKIKKKQ